MGKLNQTQRNVVQANCKSVFIADKNSNNVIVNCSSSEGGELVRSVLQAAYPSYKFYEAERGNSLTSSEQVWSWLTLGGYNIFSGLSNNWKTFTVATGNSSAARQLADEIRSCILESAGYDPDNYVSEYGGNNTGGGSQVGGSKKNTTIYIIIGAALAVVLLLLLWKK